MPPYSSGPSDISPGRLYHVASRLLFICVRPEPCVTLRNEVVTEPTSGLRAGGTSTSSLVEGLRERAEMGEPAAKDPRPS
jgi:hypothetical protein